MRIYIFKYSIKFLKTLFFKIKGENDDEETRKKEEMQAERKITKLNKLALENKPKEEKIDYPEKKN